MRFAFASTMPRRAGIRSFQPSARPALPPPRRYGLGAVLLGVALALLVSAPTAREHSDRVPTSDVQGPSLFVSGLNALRPATFRLPETVDGPREAWRTYAHAPELNHHVAVDAPAAAPAAVATITVAAPIAVLNADPDITGSVPRAKVQVSRSRRLDLPPTGTTASQPLTGIETPDVITRSEPGAPGTFPPMIDVGRVFFTVDPVMLPGVPFDHLAPVDTPRRSKRGARS